MSLLWSGVILLVLGKVLKIGIIDKLGYYMIIAGVVLWGIGLVGISLPFSLPF